MNEGGLIVTLTWVMATVLLYLLVLVAGEWNRDE